MSAKRKKRNRKRSFGARAMAANRRRNPSHRNHRRRNRSRNPLPIAIHDAPAMVAGAVAGGVLSSYVPNYVLGASDTGIVGYLGNAAIAVGGSFALSKWKNLAIGWLLGGLTMTFGRVFDDYFGKQIVTFQMPVTPTAPATTSPAAPATPLSSYYRLGTYALPAASAFAAQPQLAAAAPVVTAPAAATTNPRLSTARTSGMGWARNFRAA